MIKIYFSRKNLLAMLAGFAVIFFLEIITSTISFYIGFYITTTSSPDNFKLAFTQQPYSTIALILQILSFFSPVVGGFIVGWIIKKTGALYGATLGLIIKILSLGFALLVFVLPLFLTHRHNFLITQQQALAQKNIFNQLLHTPITIILTALGGYLGEHFHKQKRKPTL